jgi:hypothetical protein
LELSASVGFIHKESIMMHGHTVLKIEKKNNQLTMYMEIIGVCSEIRKQHSDTLCGQTAEFLNVKPGGI